uniref:Fibrinogen C-terminal domain-containing protein n=1 Tax=Leptobrachium leishanense TaxID=445787 RepID=A0A8C5WML3_9ANUR
MDPLPGAPAPLSRDSPAPGWRGILHRLSASIHLYEEGYILSKQNGRHPPCTKRTQPPVRSTDTAAAMKRSSYCTLLVLVGVLAVLAQDTFPDVKLVGINASDKLSILQGHPGTPGAPGMKGEPGPAGLKGDAGIPGKVGVTGEKGDTGALGATGKTGQRGAKGDTGPHGNTGNTGVTGDKVAKNCKDLLNMGFVLTGSYIIYPDGKKPLMVLCDMHTDGGGWIVIQRRVDNSVDFYNDWETYKRGFGNQMSNFWLGNENIHRITSTGKYQLRVDLEDFENVKASAAYDDFRLEGEKAKYTLRVGSFTGGNAGDSLKQHNGKPFSTKDRDNDDDDNKSPCAVSFIGAWWFASCYHSHLNGEYLIGKHNLEPRGRGVKWNGFRTSPYSLKLSEMKIRPSAT